MSDVGQALQHGAPSEANKKKTVIEYDLILCEINEDVMMRS
jgi:hypothetical protein